MLRRIASAVLFLLNKSVLGRCPEALTAGLFESGMMLIAAL